MFQYKSEEVLQAIASHTAEVLPGDKTAQEVEFLVEKANASGQRIRHYIGFEISGQIHLGTGISAALKIKELTLAGVECTIWLATYHTVLNRKLDGTLPTIEAVSRTYFGPLMLLCCEIVGCDMSLVQLAESSQVYEEGRRNNKNYWWFDLSAAKALTLSRVKKSISITGKDLGEDAEFALLRYPVMQVADAFFLNTRSTRGWINANAMC
jgi:tyrosyl-tRNA synthetase